jgi:5-methylcytosine-specific restriction endonuclease McrA
MARRYTYIRTCKKCGEEFPTNNPLQQLHIGCKVKRIERAKEFAKKRIDVLIRDNQVCQNCGFDFKQGGESVQKHAHHIDKNPLNNDINNLVILCASCHQLAHHSDLKFKFKKDFKPKEYKVKLPKGDKFYFKNIA